MFLELLELTTSYPITTALTLAPSSKNMQSLASRCKALCVLLLSQPTQQSVAPIDRRVTTIN